MGTINNRVRSQTLSQKIREQILSVEDCNKIWRWDMDSSTIHIFKKMWLTFLSICQQQISLLAKLKLITKHVLIPITRRKIVWFEKDSDSQTFCTWDWFTLRTTKHTTRWVEYL